MTDDVTDDVDDAQQLDLEPRELLGSHSLDTRRLGKRITVGRLVLSAVTPADLTDAERDAVTAFANGAEDVRRAAFTLNLRPDRSAPFSAVHLSLRCRYGDTPETASGSAPIFVALTPERWESVVDRKDSAKVTAKLAKGADVGFEFGREGSYRDSTTSLVAVGEGESVAEWFLTSVAGHELVGAHRLSAVVLRQPGREVTFDLAVSCSVAASRNAEFSTRVPSWARA